MGVVGGGTAGASIALSYAMSGRDVVVYNRTAGSSALALARIGRMANDLVAAEYLATGEAVLAQQRIRPTNHLAEVARCQYVVEAIPEDLLLKQEILAELDRFAEPDVLLVSASSGLTATLLATQCPRPDRVLVVRHFLPAQVIRSVEVAPGKLTSPAATEAAVAVAADCGQEPLVCRRDVRGGIAPRIQQAVLGEAFAIVADGVAEPAEVDSVLATVLGPRFAATGIFERLDFAGLDTVGAILRAQDRPVPPALAERIERGEHGVKTGRGFYDWGGDRQAQRELEVIRHLVTHLPARPRSAPDVLIEFDLLEPFIDASTAAYRACTPAEPPACFAILVGRAEADLLTVVRVEFGRNVRDSDPAALTEFETTVVPCFGSAYGNANRGFWCDADDLLRIGRTAQADGLEILGSIHLHPDWHRIGPPNERAMRISHHPTPMDRYVLGQTGWPLNMICYLERRDGVRCHTVSAWSPDATQLTMRYTT